MDFKDYYKILGVDPSADDKAIKLAYRKLARKYHPDVSDHHDAENRFKDVAEAYEVLKSAEKRADYDGLRQYGVHGQAFTPPPGWQPGDGVYSGQSMGDGDFSDFFASIFGRGFQASDFAGAGAAQAGRSFGEEPSGVSRRGQDIETDIPVFLEDTLQTASKTISYQLRDITKTLNVKIPAGVADGERIRLKGQGAPGIGSAPPGDLYLRVRLVPHPLFDVEGHNLVMTLPVAPWEAALGTRAMVPTLSGKVHLTVPANSHSGQRLRIKGKGLVKRDQTQGDLYAVIKVTMPKNCDDKAKAYWRKLAEHAAFDPREEWSESP